MGDAETNTPTLDDLMTVNEELTALVDAGVPLELDLPGRGAELATNYARLSATLGRRISHGMTLAGALSKSGDDIPRTYRSLMLLGLQHDQLNLALDSSRALAKADDDSRFTIRAGLIYPCIVICLAYLGTIACLLWLLPLMVSTYDEPGMQLGRWLRTLEMLRASLPYWVFVPPALVALVVVWRGWRRGVRGRPRRQQPDWLHLSDRLRYAQFAEICAELLQSGTPRSNAIDLAAGACGGLPASGESASAHAARDSDISTATTHSHNVATLPPLLSFVLSGGLSDSDCSQALRAAATSYRQVSLHRQHRFQRWLPLLLLIFVGGAVVLLYGLMLFLPMAELLRTLSRPA